MLNNSTPGSGLFSPPKHAHFHFRRPHAYSVHFSRPPRPAHLLHLAPGRHRASSSSWPGADQPPGLADYHFLANPSPPFYRHVRESGRRPTIDRLPTPPAPKTPSRLPIARQRYLPASYSQTRRPASFRRSPSRRSSPSSSDPA
ncbi:hypothetical protein NL676_008739 [Syzygium grande]|nr:hypothetical protein NL676_008739 [Syzygium grande]